MSEWTALGIAFFERLQSNVVECIPSSADTQFAALWMKGSDLRPVFASRVYPIVRPIPLLAKRPPKSYRLACFKQFATAVSDTAVDSRGQVVQFKGLDIVPPAQPPPPLPEGTMAPPVRWALRVEKSAAACVPLSIGVGVPGVVVPHSVNVEQSGFWGLQWRDGRWYVMAGGPSCLMPVSDVPAPLRVGSVVRMVIDRTSSTLSFELPTAEEHYVPPAARAAAAAAATAAAAAAGATEAPLLCVVATPTLSGVHVTLQIPPLLLAPTISGAYCDVRFISDADTLEDDPPPSPKPDLVALAWADDQEKDAAAKAAADASRAADEAAAAAAGAEAVAASAAAAEAAAKLAAEAEKASKADKEKDKEKDKGKDKEKDKKDKKDKSEKGKSDKDKKKK